MQPRTYRILGYVQIAAGILLLVPTIQSIRLFGFDNSMIPVLLCTPVLCLCSIPNFRKAAKLEREQKKEK